MINTPTSYDDVIDSRDIIDRIEELEDTCVNWVVGWNTPGCLPDCDPAEFADWEDAAEYFKETLKRFQEEDEENAPERAKKFGAAATLFAEQQAEEEEYSDNAGGLSFWVTRGDGVPSDFQDADELLSLRLLADEAQSCTEDWTYGATLVRDSFFKEHAKELADDIGAINKESHWPHNCIDWDQAERELKMDYSSVEFCGVIYWVR